MKLASTVTGKTLLVLFSMSLLATGAAQDTSKQQAAPPHAQDKSTPNMAAPLKIDKPNLSYALGVDTGKGLKQEGIVVDIDLLIKGLRQAYSGETLTEMSEHEVAVTLMAFSRERKQEAFQALKQLAEKNKKAGEEFIAENAKKEGVVTLPSGLQYRVLKQGTGTKPTLADKVVCHYRGMLLDGTEFDTSHKRQGPVTFPLKGLMNGWKEALQLMPTGSIWEVFIPPQLAYGERGVTGIIGPYATLKFELELLSVESKGETTAAAAHLEQNKPKAENEDSSGGLR